MGKVKGQLIDSDNESFAELFADLAAGKYYIGSKDNDCHDYYIEALGESLNRVYEQSQSLMTALEYGEGPKNLTKAFDSLFAKVDKLKELVKN